MVVAIVILLIILLNLFLKFNHFKNNYSYVFLKYLNYAVIIALLLECFLFNFRFWQSVFYQKDILNNYTITFNEENNYIEILDINKKVNNIYLDITSDKELILNYNLFYTDEANELYFDAGKRDYIMNVNKSHYLKVNPSGNIKNIKIEINNYNHNYKINEIAINSRLPFYFNLLRYVTVALFILSIFVINPQNKLGQIKYDFKYHKIINAIFIILLTFIFSIGTLFNVKSYTVKKTSQYSQYKNLARAIASKDLALDLEVDERLNELPNPYDTTYRDSILNRYNDYYWDYAFYNGKYYSYFGIVPCLLTYLPFYLIMHQDLPNNIAISIGIFMYIISIFSLLYTLIKRYYPKTSYLNYLLLCVFMAFAGGLANFSGEPTFYNLPIIMGVSFALLGLNFYLLATSGPKLKGKYLFLGSLCFALIAGCRPQLLLSFILGIVILFPYLKKKELFSQKSLKNTLLLVMPFIVIAIALMSYNYLRFGSVFDFGANYNLTTNDMTKRGFKIDRIPLGLYHFLFAPTKISLIFPFINSYAINTSYLGKTIYEKMYGGFFFMNIICLLSLFAPKFKKLIKEKNLSLISILSVIVAILIIIFDTEAAGILPRYIADFGFLIALSTIIILLALLNSNTNKDIKKVLIGLIIASIIYNLLTFFLARNIFANEDILRLIYYKFYYTFMFWL